MIAETFVINSPIAFIGVGIAALAAFLFVLYVETRGDDQ